jgi:holo-[acyl-carrier protein] synthase
VVITDDNGRPTWQLAGSVAAAVERAGIVSVHLSLSHDAGSAVAMVVAEG